MVHCASAFEPGASGLPYHCTSICVRSWCNCRASLWIPNQNKKPQKCVNAILTRQLWTCSQRSSMSAGSKRRALENYFPERICHMFLMSKCRGDWDLGLCTSWLSAEREPLCHAKFWFFWGRNTFFSGCRHCAAVLFSQVPKKCPDLDLSLLYILILGRHSKFAWENNFVALVVYFPRPCSSAGRRFAVPRSHLHYYLRIVSFQKQ